MNITILLTFGFVTVAAVTDIKSHKIYNWTTYPGILTALGLHAVGTALARWSGVGEETRKIVGWIGIDDSCYGLLVCGGCMVACYVLFGVGGGDVKLIAMVGAFLGLEKGISVMLWMFVLSGAVALVLLIWRDGLWNLTKKGFLFLRAAIMFRTFRPGGQKEEAKTRLFLAPSAVAAVILVALSIDQRLSLAISRLFFPAA